MKLIFATNNRHKLEEVSAVLGEGYELLTPADFGITEDIPETCDTLEGNALQKARYVFDRVAADGRFAVFADDTGLEVAALGGAPGVRSARYAADAGEGSRPDGGGTFDDNNRLLLRNLEGAADRSARFRTVIALILRGDSGRPEEYLFEGRVEGRIIDEYRGSGGFGYDPVFVPEVPGMPEMPDEGDEGDERNGGRGDETRCDAETFAEMSAERKNAISHRGRAVERLANFLKNNIV
ncbi:MAG: non-canonical purine NTP pyrophosphatase [Alistipes sp.]|nr:non-canonical purine NTP pyrophosphatase [Alistipes sp.]